MLALKKTLPLLGAFMLCVGVSTTTFAHGKVLESAVIDFDAGQAALTDSERSELLKLVQDARARGRIDKVEIAAWSDNERPTKGDLAKADQNLAKHRAEAIKEAIQMTGIDESFAIFNMADSASWWARTFNTSDAELDSVFAMKNSSQIKREDFKIIKDNGGPSKAVVVLKMKQKM